MFYQVLLLTLPMSRHAPWARMLTFMPLYAMYGFVWIDATEDNELHLQLAIRYSWWPYMYVPYVPDLFVFTEQGMIYFVQACFYLQCQWLGMLPFLVHLYAVHRLQRIHVMKLSGLHLNVAMRYTCLPPTACLVFFLSGHRSWIRSRHSCSAIPRLFTCNATVFH